MPAITTDSKPKASAKRKKEVGKEVAQKRAKSEGSSDEEDGEDEQSRILLLENEILESKKNYNNIVTLIDILKNQEDDVEDAVVAAVSLCRVFLRLLAMGKLVKKKDLAEKDLVVVRWLRDRFSDYKEALLPLLRVDEAALTALTLAMRVLKAEAQHLDEKVEYTFPRTFLTAIVSWMVEPTVDDTVRGEILEKFVQEYDDVRFYTFHAIRYASSFPPSPARRDANLYQRAPWKYDQRFDERGGIQQDVRIASRHR
jgi:U3 small nucleolar RNA-associated protein 19